MKWLAELGSWRGPPSLACGAFSPREGRELSLVLFAREKMHTFRLPEGRGHETRFFAAALRRS